MAEADVPPSFGAELKVAYIQTLNIPDIYLTVALRRTPSSL
jgi:hypothetical protein